MAVVQISKIQHRRGRKNSGTSLPQLASAEIGWAIDTQELFIGNGSVSEGAPYVGNTKILTEHDNILDLALQYQYKRNDATIQTGPTASQPVQRSLQERLDDTITVRSFGAVANGTTDDTAAIQRAIDQLYLNDATKGSVSSRIVLTFEAGVYKITQPLRIPPYATLRGAGMDKTVIRQTGNFPVAYTVNSSSTPGSYKDLVDLSTLNQPRGIEITGMTLEHTVAAQPILKLIATKDSHFEELKLKGVWNYITGSQITISSIALGKTFTTSVAHGLSVGDEVFPRTSSNGLVANKTYYVYSVPSTTTFTLTEKIDILVPVELSSFTDATGLSILAEKLSNTEVGVLLSLDSSAVPCSGNEFDYCEFTNLSYAIDSTYDIDNNVFDECSFVECSRGVRFGHAVNGLTSGKLSGPLNNRILNSKFYRIKEYGIDIVHGTGNLSATNRFVEVGNDGGTEGSAKYNVIRFQSSGNLSSDDYFSRSVELTSNVAYINDVAYVGEVAGVVKSNHKFNTQIQVQIGTNPLLRLPADDSVSHVVRYFYQSQAQSITRHGTLYINVDRANDQVHITDDCSVIGNSSNFEKLTFSATLEDANLDAVKDTIYVRYANAVSSENGYINYWYESLS